MLLLKIIVFFIGFGIAVGTMLSALRTFVLPRSARDRLTAAVFIIIRQLFNLRMYIGPQNFNTRDRILALYVPVTLIVLLVVWLVLELIGYALMFWAFGIDNWDVAVSVSGSSLLTLGFTTVDTVAQRILAFSEAIIGLILVALLIAYVPTLYSAFSRREEIVTLLQVRAGTPPSATVLLQRYFAVKRLHLITELWVSWEVWFADIEETHTSLPMLAYYRSPQPSNSWVTAAGTILDAAALTVSVLDIAYDSQAALCIRAGFISLRRIADFFQLPYDADPNPADPISVTRQEFDQACDELAATGLALKADRDQAWRDFAGWRVNYDKVLLALAILVMAPPSPWCSDKVLKDGVRLPLK